MSEPFRFLRLRQVLERTALPRSTLYEMMRKGEFPKQVKISQRSVAWREDEVDAWCMARVMGVSLGVSAESNAA
jgi:prophage regulatory protein